MTEDVDYRTTSRRPEFAELPEPVRAEVARLAGAEGAHAHPAVTSGFTGAYAGLLELRDGRRVFAKAADPDHPFAHAALPREASVLGRLEGRAGAPRLLGAGPAGVWNVNVLEAIDGHLPVCRGRRRTPLRPTRPVSSEPPFPPIWWHSSPMPPSRRTWAATRRR